jgi:3'-phosphoadenosine 5'-phosphosulfate sulfotransferase (PAPS reductase)/FAD synthetase
MTPDLAAEQGDLGLWPDRSPSEITEQAKTIVAAATGEHDPVATYLLFSGGDDSLLLLNMLGEFVDGVVFVNTGTGIPETTEFVRSTVADSGLILHELNPPLSYEQVFIEQPIINGLPGPGMHQIAYNRLKERALSAFRRDHNLSGRERIMYLTGIRRDESRQRMGYDDSVVDREGRTVWVNPVFYVTKRERNAYIAARGITRNPVSEHLHISGECLCGAYARPGELAEIEFFYPEVAARIRGWEERARERGLAYCSWGTRRPDAPVDQGGRLCQDCVPLSLFDACEVET